VNSALADASTLGEGVDEAVRVDRPNNEGRLRVLLRRCSMADVGDPDGISKFFGGEDTEVGESVSVRERCTRLGNARGPPGTEGALVISTGRGFGGAGGGLKRRACVDVLLLLLLFLVLEFLPREEKKPPATLDPAEESGADDKGDPITVVE
jgi:hypothetical protein